MSYELISVVLAVRNGEPYLREAIDSVLVQAYHPIEILLIDSHSTDNTLAIARSYPQVRCLSQRNRGVADARNVGIEAARGAFIAFLSHDDFWTPTKLQSQVEYMMSFPHLQYTVGRAKFFLEPGITPPAGFRKELLIGDHEAHIPETMLARRSLFDQIGNFNSELTTAEDVDWFARAKDRQIPHAVIQKVLLHKRVHHSNTSLNGSGNNDRLLNVMRESIARKRTFAGDKNAPFVNSQVYRSC
jgi:glycosyltransferase involved in cell wall biosynthesis